LILLALVSLVEVLDASVKYGYLSQGMDDHGKIDLIGAGCGDQGEYMQDDIMNV